MNLQAANAMENLLKNYIYNIHGEHGEKEFNSIITNNHLQFIYRINSHDFRYLRNKANVMLLHGELLKVCQKFNENGIKYIAFKGSVLAHQLYDNIYVRYFNDIDIFVYEQDFDRALAILEQNEYTLSLSGDPSDEHHFTLFKGRVNLELHKHILDAFADIDETFLLSHTQTISISGIDICTFDTTTTFIHMLYHLYMHTMSYHSSSNCFFLLLFSQKYPPRTNRFFARAYEIALYSKRYFDSINWGAVLEELRHQNLNILFCEMVYNIIDIFPSVFPESVIKAISGLNYNNSDEYKQYESFFDIYFSGEGMQTAIGKYVDKFWKGAKQLDLSQNAKASFCLNYNPNRSPGRVVDTPDCFGCECNIVKTDDLKLTFTVSDSDLCYSEAENYDTHSSDGIHIMLCETQPYSYNSIYLFPKAIDKQFKIVPFDILNENVVSNDLIKAEFKKLDNGYRVTTVFTEKFFKQNDIPSTLYMGLVVRSCNNATVTNKISLLTAEDNQKWFNPLYFIKINF
ncbi:MAG: hypothetical protein E7525_00580 [Ruminococcaceae bacterium]|nr:hypothetical protein [Oscillospiraceae bacterium]